MKPRALLAWEFGAGRGHLVTLQRVAAALGPAFTFDAALCRMTHAAELEPLCELVFQGAGLNYDGAHRQQPGGARTATFGEYLGDCGFRDGPLLARQVAWWRDVLVARASDLVITDYAPCALLAAQTLGIPSVAVGTGYGLPPSEMDCFPPFLTEYQDRLYDEQEMVETINRALGPLGLPPLTRLPQIYRCWQDLVRTFDILDPYAGHRDQSLLAPVSGPLREAAGSGDEIFVYFSTTELDDPQIVEGVAGLGLPVRAFCPQIPEEAARRLIAGGAILEREPVHARLIAERSRLLVHAGQHGVLSLGLAAGIGQVSIPQHLEQLYHARRSEGLSCGKVIPLGPRSAESLRDTIRAAYDDGTMHASTAAVAGRLSQEVDMDADALIRERVLRVI